MKEMTEQTSELLNAIQSGNTLDMQSKFNEVMATKMVAALDTFKSNVAQNLFKESAQTDESTQ